MLLLQHNTDNSSGSIVSRQLILDVVDLENAGKLFSLKL